MLKFCLFARSPVEAFFIMVVSVFVSHSEAKDQAASPPALQREITKSAHLWGTLYIFIPLFKYSYHSSAQF